MIGPNKVRVTGDVHGWTKEYLAIVKDVPYSVQLGDHNFDYTHMNVLDPACHKIVGGNHDNYEKIVKCPHYLGDFGLVNLGGLTFFFIRGGYSVDRKYRIPGVSWWAEEEIPWVDGMKCVELFKQEKPALVLSHECPYICANHGVLTNSWKIEPSKTSQILQACWDAHHPAMWIFGHHHNNGWIKMIEGTEFQCLGELEYIDLEVD